MLSRVLDGINGWGFVNDVVWGVHITVWIILRWLATLEVVFRDALLTLAKLVSCFAGNR